MFYDFSRVITDPGAGENHPFSPPRDWEGDESAYRALMRERYRSLDYRTILLAWARAYARQGADVHFEGAWSAQAKEILEHLHS